MTVPVGFISGWGFSAKLLQQSFPLDREVTCFQYENEDSCDIKSIVQSWGKEIKEPMHIIAWSLGGLFAIQLADLFPDKISSVILLASQGKLVADEHDKGIDANTLDAFIEMAQNDKVSLQNKFIQWVGYPDRNKQNRLHLIKHFLPIDAQSQQGLSAMRDTDLRSQLTEIQSKVLFVVHGKDAVVKQDPEKLRSQYPQSKVIFLADAGHAAFLSHSRVYQEIVNEYIN